MGAHPVCFPKKLGTQYDKHKNIRLILGFEDIFRVAAKAVLALVIKRIPDTLHFVYAKETSQPTLF